MKIAIVGKGGSGKSTLSWLLTQRALAARKGVLAVDGDYNMDLAQNLGWQPETPPPFISTAERDFYAYQNLGAQDYYVNLPTRNDLKPFHLSPPDAFTSQYSTALSERLRLVIAGPTNPQILFGHRCSHAYVSSLKYYLPLLQLRDNEAVVVDSVAGTDMVAYGMYLGVDAMLAVVEPTRNSMGVYRQIRDIAATFHIPMYFVWSKLSAEAPAGLDAPEDRCLGSIPVDPALIGVNLPALALSTLQAADAIWSALTREVKVDPAAQWQRHLAWYENYQRQLNTSKQDPMNFVSAA